MGAFALQVLLVQIMEAMFVTWKPADGLPILRAFAAIALAYDFVHCPKTASVKRFQVGVSDAAGSDILNVAVSPVKESVTAKLGSLLD